MVSLIGYESTKGWWGLSCVDTLRDLSSPRFLVLSLYNIIYIYNNSIDMSK